MSEWQPIETAPTETCGYFASPVLIGFVEWGKGDKHRTHVGPIVHYERDNHWEFMEMDCDMFSPPTHWMPLPKAPNA